MNKQELRDRMAVLPEPPNDSHPPLWDYWRHDLWQRVVSGEDPDGFMGWPCVYHTMLQNHWPEVVEREATEIVTENGASYPASPMHPDGFYPRDDFHYLSGNSYGHSRNLIHQMYHLWKWQQVTGQRVADLGSIVEFGGGYGAMALVASRMEFGGRYTIIDLPEFLLLQEYFLLNTTTASVASGTYLFSRQLYSGYKDPAADLMIAGYSLSETDYSERDGFVWNYPAKSYLLWYSNRFEDYDNVAYFQHRLPSMLPDMNWKHWRADHMPPETWYSVGWPKSA